MNTCFNRDHRYFPEKVLEANGRKVFWAVETLVMAGCFPSEENCLSTAFTGHSIKTLFAEMAEKVASCQDKEGFWHASMLDHQSFPNPETIHQHLLLCIGLRSECRSA
jgi:rhamnogalacturonyl hydrolase YesR